MFFDGNIFIPLTVLLLLNPAAPQVKRQSLNLLSDNGRPAVTSNHLSTSRRVGTIAKEMQPSPNHLFLLWLYTFEESSLISIYHDFRAGSNAFRRKRT